MWGFVASQVLISPFLNGYYVNPSYHKRIVCQALNGERGIVHSRLVPGARPTL